MKFLNFDKVLCLCPHPDDVEYSISGTIFNNEYTQFSIFFMSNGTQEDPSATKERFKESKAFWKKFGVGNVEFNVGAHLEINLDTKDTKIGAMNFDNTIESQWISHIEGEYDMATFDAILAPSALDSHYEHAITNRVMMALGRNKSISLIEYKSPSTSNEWEPNLFVPLGSEVDLKIDALKEAFKTQNDARYFTEEAIEAFHIDFNSVKRGVKFVEQFKIRTLYEL